MSDDIIHLMDGALQLFKRTGSDKWYCSFSVTGQGQKRRSTGTGNLAQAKKKAKDIYLEAVGRASRGLRFDGFSFEHVANEFLKNYQRKVTHKEI